ncbi:predicted protein [Streptomyces sp. SPB78]|nr:predicted protein [Streptomyces sp. SPB78]
MGPVERGGARREGGGHGAGRGGRGAGGHGSPREAGRQARREAEHGSRREAGCGRRREALLAALVEDLPDEDLEAQADACRFGGEPRREEAEYPALLAEARE